jgi:hypothetical protein
MGEVPLDKGKGRIRAQNLASMGGRKYPRHSIYGRSEIVLISFETGSGMKRDPDLDLRGFCPGFGRDLSLDLCRDG